MYKKFNFQKLISGIGIAAIALVGSLIGAPAANAATTLASNPLAVQLTPTWDPNVFSYTTEVSPGDTFVDVNINPPTTSSATVTVNNGTSTQTLWNNGPGSCSAPCRVTLGAQGTTTNAVFTVNDGVNTGTYTIAITRPQPAVPATVTNVSVTPGDNGASLSMTFSGTNSTSKVSWMVASAAALFPPTANDVRDAYSAYTNAARFAHADISSGSYSTTITGLNSGTLYRLYYVTSVSGSIFDAASSVSYEQFSTTSQAQSLYTITFNANGGTPGLVSSRTQTSAGSSILLPMAGPDAPTRPGYTLQGWALVSVSASASINSYVPSGSITMYAIWNSSQGNVYQTCVSNGSTVSQLTSFAISTQSLDSTGTYQYVYNNDPTLNNCSVPVSQSQGTYTAQGWTRNGVLIPGSLNFGAGYAYIASSTPRTLSQLLSSPIFSGLTFVDGDVLERRIYVGLNRNPNISDVPTFSASLTIYPNSSNPTTPTAQVVRLPEWQNKAINSITKVIDQSGVKLIGGKIKLDGVTASDLKKVTLNGKEISVESLNPEAPVLNIPAGAGTGDLVFTLANGGTWTFQNAVRYVEPIKAGKPMKLFNFDNGSTTVNSYQVAQIAAQTADLMRGSTVECFGYVAKKNANTVARATAQAEAICAEALKINPALKKVITIGVDEIMALQPNRIRVFG